MPIAEPISVPTNAPHPNRYGAMCTEVYDLDKPPGSLPDVPFYLERLAGTDGPILEAGVGTGRLLIFPQEGSASSQRRIFGAAPSVGFRTYRRGL